MPHGGPRLTSAYQATTVTSAPSSALKPLSLLGAPIGHMTYWLLPRGVGGVRAGKARIWGGVHPADFSRIPGRGPCRGLDGTSPWPGVWPPGVSALTLTLLGSRRRARGRARVRSAFPMSPALPLWLPGCCRLPACSVLTLSHNSCCVVVITRHGVFSPHHSGPSAFPSGKGARRATTSAPGDAASP